MSNFQNRTLYHGDNLDFLRGMNSKTVHLIATDPPFNKNRDFHATPESLAKGGTFTDRWRWERDVHQEWVDSIKDDWPKVWEVIDAARAAYGHDMAAFLCWLGVRLLEMHRILTDDGSIYLHCDPTASHYLKLLMDAVFGKQSFRSEITWRRTNAKGLAFKGYPRNSDILLYYTKGNNFSWNRPFVPHDKEYVKKSYRHIEPETGRRYRLDNLANPNHNRPNLTYEFQGVTRVWRWTKERMQEAYDAGLVVQSRPGSVPALKRYLDEMKGVPVDTIWDDISPAQSKERTGYPTQKPLALLERIIRASSNPGDLVLDPFCGCATACVAADRLERRWAGIDISPKAVELVNMRLQQAMGSLFHHRYVTARTDIPRRTDIDAPIPYRQNRHVLFGQQEGLCAGCRTMFPFRNFTIDHIIPQSRGGTDHLENLQLLCGACNSTKGDRPQEYLVARLKEAGIL